MTFRVGGGGGQDTYVALCMADGTELQKARGIDNQVMQKVSWDLTPYAGKKLFLKSSINRQVVGAISPSTTSSSMRKCPERRATAGGKQARRSTQRAQMPQ